MDFFSTVMASSIGFVLAKIVTAWFDANITKASFLEAERDADVARMEALIEECVKAGSAYWAAAEANGHAEVKYQIPADISEIGGISNDLFRQDKACLDAVSLELNRFDDAITGGEFGSEKRNQDLARIQSIRTTAGALKNRIRGQRRKLKPRWFGNHR